MSERNVSSTPEENSSFLVNEIIGKTEDQRKAINNLAGSVNALGEKIDKIVPAIKEDLSEDRKRQEQSLDKKLFILQQNTKPMDTSPIKEAVIKGIGELKSTVSAIQRPVTKKLQVLLFPEQDAKLFYKIVFGRWYLMIVIALLLKLAFSYFSHQQEINKQIDMQTAKDDRITKAWIYLYSRGNKTTRKQMDSAWLHSNREK